MGKDLIGALDIGSSSIKLLVVKKDQKGNFDLFYKLVEESKGVKRGEIIEPQELSRALKNISQIFLKETGKKLPPLFVNLGGDHLFSLLSKGLISVSRADQKISQEDIERVLKAAQSLSIGENKTVFDTIPLQFIIDGKEKVEDPVGLKGMRLEAETLLLVGNERHLENLKRTILLSEFEILDFIPSPIALSTSILKEREREIGVCLLNLGAQTTEVSVFEDGKLIYFSVLPEGTISVTNKIAIFLKVDFEIAERIKKEYGSCFCSKRKREKIEIEGEVLSFTLSSLSKIIREEYLKIFEKVRKELKKINKEKNLPAGIVLTGGGAKIEKIANLAKQKFKLPTRIGKPQKIPGLEGDPLFALAEGLILAGTSQESKSSVSFFSKIISFFKNFLP